MVTEGDCERNVPVVSLYVKAKVLSSDSVWRTSSRVRASATVTMNSEGPTKARRRLSELTARASGARPVPRATTSPEPVGREINKADEVRWYLTKWLLNDNLNDDLSEMSWCGCAYMRLGPRCAPPLRSRRALEIPESQRWTWTPRLKRSTGPRSLLCAACKREAQDS